MNLFILTCSILILSSCSIFKKKFEYPYNNNLTLKSRDYAKNLESIAEIFNKKHRGNLHEIQFEKSRYLRDVLNKIYNNNETLLSRVPKHKLFIINDKRSFYFSFPGNNYYFSTALMDKYLKSEELFLTILIGEIVRNNFLIYEKKKLIPFNEIDVNELVSLTYISLESRARINNITYEVMSRSGYDPEVSLLWLQIKNRNTAEFDLLYDNSNSISKEEYLLKNYIVKRKSAKHELYDKNSSKNFYRFKALLARRWK